jgi:RNA polymerase subunit RPABC4/transcription elongation factor Spt4
LARGECITTEHAVLAGPRHTDPGKEPYCHSGSSTTRWSGLILPLKSNTVSCEIHRAELSPNGAWRGQTDQVPQHRRNLTAMLNRPRFVDEFVRSSPY